MPMRSVIVTWPNLITMSEIGPHLISHSVYDAYNSWIDVDFPKTLERLSREQAIEALEWAVSDIRKSTVCFDRIKHMRRQIYTLCWKKYNDRSTLPLLATGFCSFIRNYETPFWSESLPYIPSSIVYTEKDFYDDKRKRYNLVSEILCNRILSGKDICCYIPQLLMPDDISFIISMIEKNAQRGLQKEWVSCLSYLRYGIPLPEMADKWNYVHYLYPEVFDKNAEGELKRRMSFDDCEEKRRERENRRRKENVEKQEKERKDLLSFYKNIITQKDSYLFLPSFLNYCQRDSKEDSLTFEESELWNSFSLDEKQIIAQIAKVFLIKTPPLKRQKNRFYSSIPLAFRCIYVENAILLDDLPEQIWVKFSKDIFDGIEFDNKGKLKDIIIRMKERYPDTFRKQLLLYINEQIKSGYTVYLEKYEDVLDDEILNVFVSICFSIKCDPLIRFNMLNRICKRNPEILKNVLSKKSFSDSFIKKFGIYTGLLLIDLFPEQRNIFLDAIKRSPQKGKEWFEDLMKIEMFEHELLAIFKKFSIQLLTDFYIWFGAHFPYSERPQHSGCFSPTPIDEIYVFMDRLFYLITESKELSVLDSLERIKNVFPEANWLDEYIKKAKYIELKIHCPVYEHCVIKQIIDINNDLLLFKNAQDLLAVVLAALSDYQTFLTGKENPRIEDLWNSINGKYTHKNEEDFSDHIKSFLDTRLNKHRVFINREVQLNRGLFNRPGSITDIWINASSVKSSKLSLCIEVKGSWNPEAKDSFNSQLIDKYMKEGGAAAGIYLVGWFQSKKCPVKNVWSTRQQMLRFLKSQSAIARKKDILVESTIINCEYRK